MAESRFECRQAGSSLGILTTGLLGLLHQPSHAHRPLVRVGRKSQGKGTQGPVASPAVVSVAGTARWCGWTGSPRVPAGLGLAQEQEAGRRWGEAASRGSHKYEPNSPLQTHLGRGLLIGKRLPAV